MTSKLEQPHKSFVLICKQRCNHTVSVNIWDRFIDQQNQIKTTLFVWHISYVKAFQRAVQDNKTQQRWKMYNLNVEAIEKAQNI